MSMIAGLVLGSSGGHHAPTTRSATLGKRSETAAPPLVVPAGNGSGSGRGVGLSSRGRTSGGGSTIVPPTVPGMTNTSGFSIGSMMGPTTAAPADGGMGEDAEGDEEDAERDGDDDDDDGDDDADGDAVGAVQAGADGAVQAGADAGADDRKVPGTRIDPKTGKLIKERHTLTLAQRRALRRWTNSQSVRPSHRRCIEWFQEQYGHRISQSTVSHSLSDKYERLDAEATVIEGDPRAADGPEPPLPSMDNARMRFGNWTDVERLVLLWYRSKAAAALRAGGRAAGTRPPTNAEMAAKARAIFTQLPKYRAEEPPEFSAGWIHRFKKRYGLVSRVNSPRSSAGQSSPAGAGDDRRSQKQAARSSAAAAAAASVTPVPVPNMSSGYQYGQQHSSSPYYGNSFFSNAGYDTSASGANVYGGDRGYGGGGGGGGEVGMVDDAGGNAGGTAAAEDADVALQNALRALQEEQMESEVRAEEQQQQKQQQEQEAARQGGQGAGADAGGGKKSTKAAGGKKRAAAVTEGDPAIAPIRADRPTGGNEKPVRCPFCVNVRLLKSIKEAVEHLSTHVVV